MADAQSKVKVAILAVPEVTASAVYAMYDLFAAAGRDWAFITTGVPGEPRMQPYVVARDDAPVISANGISITPDHTIDDCPEPAIVCVPDFSHMPGESCAGRLEPEVAWLRRCHAGGATLASVCTSAMLMAETGLLDGHDATIHWAYAESLARHYPTIRLHPNRSLVVTGVGQRIVMAGGGTSHLDLVLYLMADLSVCKLHLRSRKPISLTGTTPVSSRSRRCLSADRPMTRLLRGARPGRPSIMTMLHRSQR